MELVKELPEIFEELEEAKKESFLEIKKTIFMKTASDSSGSRS